MKIEIDHHYLGENEPMAGTPAQLEAALLQKFPWFKEQAEAYHWSLEELIDALDRMQAVSIRIVGSDSSAEWEGALAKSDNLKASTNRTLRDMHGFVPHLYDAFAAAKFLTGSRHTLNLESMRHALYHEGGDIRSAALRAYGLDPSEEHLSALDAVADLNKALGRSAGVPERVVVEAVAPRDQEAAIGVSRSFEEGVAQPVTLPGKHSTGSLLAKDPEGHSYLLKPDWGAVSPAAGVGEEQASQPVREAAFSAVADRWGLGDWVPEANLLLLNGKEFAAIRLLPWKFQTIYRYENDPGFASRVFQPYLDGTLHKWAVLDYVCGNPDGHAQNLMVDPESLTVRLIDHGSAFAGPGFNPGRDKLSFVPYYLRYAAPKEFHKLPPKEKLQYLPTVSQSARDTLKAWVDSLSGIELGEELRSYGINPSSSVARLERIQGLAKTRPVDKVINALWAGF